MAFSVLKVSIHDLHVVAIAEMYDPIPFCISLPDSMMSYHLFVAFSSLPYVSNQVAHYNYILILPKLVNLLLEL